MSNPTPSSPGRAKIIPPDTLFLPYQARWVADRSRLKLALKARQIGWTWATAYSLVERKAQTNARCDAWISSRDEVQSILFLQDCKNFAQTLNIAAKDLGHPLVDDRNPAYTLQFSNGIQIHSMSSSPDAQAGKRGDRILDEFALHTDPRRLYAIAYPGITWGGSLEIFSTPRGTNNYFNVLIQEILHGGNPKKFSFHKASLQDALEQGLLHRLQSRLPLDDPRQGMDETDYFNFIRSGCPDEDNFLEEYMCQPSNDANAFLTYDLIAACEYPLTENWNHTDEQLSARDASLYVGVDIGRDHDLTVIWIIEKLASLSHTRRVLILEKQTFDAQERALYEILQLPGIKRCCIDQTGMGRQFTERAQQRFGKNKIEGIQFTALMKEKLAYPVRAAFEDGAIRVPNDTAIRADLRAIKKDTTSNGNIRFSADRGKNGHADRFWALALALHATTIRKNHFWAEVGRDMYDDDHWRPFSETFGTWNHPPTGRIV